MTIANIYVRCDMNEQQQAALLKFFTAVGQPKRVKIIGLLANRAYSIRELSADLKLKEMDVYNHVTSLMHAGLVQEDTSTPSPTFRFSSNGLAEFRQVILAGELDPDGERYV